MNLVVDSFAWMELFKGGTRGEKVANLLKTHKKHIYTTTANLYEIYYRLTQQAGVDKREEALTFIKNITTPIDVDEDLAFRAGEIRLIEGFSAIDAFTLAAARRISGKVLTGDQDFKDMTSDTIMI